MPVGLLACQALLNPLAAFHKTKASIASFYTNNNLPSFPCSYLSTFQFMSPFISCYCFQLSAHMTPALSWKMHVDIWQLASFFYIISQPTYHDSMISLKLPCIPLNIFGNIKDHTLQRGRVQLGATAIQTSSPPFPFFLFLFCAGEEKREEREKEMKEEAALLPAFVSIMCHGRSWLSCSVWLSLLLQQSLFPRWKIHVPQRQERRSLSYASISARLSVAGLCSHLADTSSSADTSSLHGLSWLTGSCLYG